MRTWLIAFLLMAAAMAASCQHKGITASISPAHPTVGVTKVTIKGRASPGAKITDQSTFPDGKVHRFSFTAGASGEYKDGPFQLNQLGVFHDVLRDEATGSVTKLTYGGGGDFTMEIDSRSQTIGGGEQATFDLILKSVSGFVGKVTLDTPNLYMVPAATPQWSAKVVSVSPAAPTFAELQIETLPSTNAGTYHVALTATNGRVTHRIEPELTLKITGPKPRAVTASFSPYRPVIGVTRAHVKGTGSPGEYVTDISTWPDGTTHRFSSKANGSGAYDDGPFLLEELGTYHDVVLDGGTGAKTKISYQGAGDFKVSVDQPTVKVPRGGEVSFPVTFKSLQGFNGRISPAPPDLSRLPGASASWSAPWVLVRSNGSNTARLTIKTSPNTPPGNYQIAVKGVNGSVTHGAASIKLAVR